MSVKLRKKNVKHKITLYLDIYFNGERKYEFLKLYLHIKPKNSIERAENKETLNLAENIRSKKELELNNNRYNFTADFKQKTNFFTFADSFLEKHKGKSIYNDYKSTLNHFKNSLNKTVISIGAIDSTHIEAFKNYLAESDLMQNTCFNYLARLKTLLEQAKKEGYANQNPASNVKNFKKAETHKEFLTINEIKQLASTPTKYEQVKKAFLFACYTGLRHVDVANLTRENIKIKTIDGNAIHFVEILQQKTENHLSIRLNKSALEQIGEQPEQQLQLFKISKYVGETNRYLKIWAKEAGFSKDLTFHMARHSFATNLLIHKDKTHADIQIVSKLLGHTSLKHTQIYAKIVDSMMNEATVNLPEL